MCKEARRWWDDSSKRRWVESEGVVRMNKQNEAVAFVVHADSGDNFHPPTRFVDTAHGNHDCPDDSRAIRMIPLHERDTERMMTTMMEAMVMMTRKMMMMMELWTHEYRDSRFDFDRIRHLCACVLRNGGHTSTRTLGMDPGEA